MHQGSPRTVGYLHTLLAYAEWMGFNSFYEEDLGSVGLVIRVTLVTGGRWGLKMTVTRQ